MAFRASPSGALWPSFAIAGRAAAGCLAAGLAVGAAQAADGLPSLEELVEVLNSAPRQLNLTLENDAFMLGKTTDRYYTAGEQLILRFPFARALPAAGDDAPSPPQLRYAYGFRAGQQLFTPRNLSETPGQLQPHDRPYAGWIYAGVFKETFWSQGAEGRYLRVGFDIGCLGPCALGEQSQDAAHAVFSGDHAEGWNAQIHNGLGVQLNGSYSPLRFVPLPGLELTPYVGAEVGNVYVNAAGGVSIRAGRLVSPFRADSQYHDLVPNLPAVGDSGGAGEVFAFARLQGRAVAYDATLQGGWFANSSHTVDPERASFESEWGAAYKARSWAISYSLTVQSSQVEGPPFSWTWHRWGRIQVAWMFD